MDYGRKQLLRTWFASFVEYFWSAHLTHLVIFFPDYINETAAISEIRVRRREMH